jgi:hypothetical protein
MQLLKGEKHGSRASTDESHEEWRAVNKQPKRGTTIMGHVTADSSYLCPASGGFLDNNIDISTLIFLYTTS